MIHQNWQTAQTLKQVKCVHTNAKKYMVDRALFRLNDFEGHHSY